MKSTLYILKLSIRRLLLVTRRYGRAKSSIRTPALIRDYLAGHGEWDGDTPEEAAQRPELGDYVARIHQRVKAYIKAATKARGRYYQWPRRHSFGALVQHLITLGLLERTGATGEPEHRGAGQLGTASGFSSKSWVRLTAGSLARDEWADPVGYLARVYPSMRRIAQPLPTATIPVGQASEPQRPVQPLAPLDRERERVQRQVEQFERRRTTLVSRLERSSGRVSRVMAFQALYGETELFLSDLAKLYSSPPFREASDTMDLLRRCIAELEQEQELPQLRDRAIESCQNTVRLLAEVLSLPLSMPSAAPASRRRKSARRVEEPPVPSLPGPLVPHLDMPETFTTRSAPRIIRHLELLSGFEQEQTEDEMLAMAKVVGEWGEAVEESLANEESRDSPRDDRIAALEDRIELLGQLESALEDLEPETAIDVLQGL